jgi:hypothetical protein
MGITTREFPEGRNPMTKNEFKRAYSLYREERYFQCYLFECKEMRYPFSKTIHNQLQELRVRLQSIYNDRPEYKKILGKVWYQAAPAYPPLSIRQHTLSRELHRWRIDHNIPTRSKY